MFDPLIFLASLGISSPHFGTLGTVLFVPFSLYHYTWNPLFVKNGTLGTLLLGQKEPSLLSQRHLVGPVLTPFPCMLVE